MVEKYIVSHVYASTVEAAALATLLIKRTRAEAVMIECLPKTSRTIVTFARSSGSAYEGWETVVGDLARFVEKSQIEGTDCLNGISLSRPLPSGGGHEKVYEILTRINGLWPQIDWISIQIMEMSEDWLGNYFLVRPASTGHLEVTRAHEDLVEYLEKLPSGHTYVVDPALVCSNR